MLNSSLLSLILLSFFLLMGCQSSRTLRPDQIVFPVKLELNGHQGREDVFDYHTESAIKTVTPDKIARNEIETMNFTTRTKLTKIEGQQVSQTLTVASKDGEMSLHDMAFPELDETIELAFSRQGTVLKAGDYPKEGIFYVPRISLPDKPVSIGDTWPLEIEWISAKNKIRMKLSMTTKFLRTLPCGKDTCADLQLSGRVTLPGVPASVIKLDSELIGRVFFAIGEGVEVWSEIRNMESMNVDGAEIYVEACLESVLREPRRLQWNEKFQPDCSVPFNTDLTTPL